MNLYHLKKTELVKLCGDENIEKSGTKQELANRLVSTKKYWNLKFISTKKVQDDKSFYTEQPQVSKEVFVSFDSWIQRLKLCYGDFNEHELDFPLRDYFDAGVIVFDMFN